MRPESRLIIDEFLDSNEARLRKNALSALATLGGKDEIKEIVKAALSDRDDTVRGWAEDELLRLEGESAESLAQELDRALEEPSTRWPAYALLGTLSTKGGQLPTRRRSFLEQLRLVRRATRPAKLGRDLVERFRYFVPGLVGGVIGVLVMGLCIGVAFGVATLQEMTSYALYALFAAAVLSITAAWRSRAIRDDQYYGAAMVVELGRVLLGSAIFPMFVVIIQLLDGSLVSKDIYALLVIPGVIVLVRLGTLIAPISSQGYPRALATLTGASVGGLVHTLIYSLFVASENAESAGAMWPVLVAAVFGPALTFATIDASQPLQTRRRRGSKDGAWCLIALTSVLAVIAVARARTVYVTHQEDPTRRPDSLASMLPDKAVQSLLASSPPRGIPVSVVVNSFPYFMPFELSSPQWIAVDHSSPAASTAALFYVVFNDKGFCAENRAPYALVDSLESGVFILQITTYASGGFGCWRTGPDSSGALRWFDGPYPGNLSTRVSPTDILPALLSSLFGNDEPTYATCYADSGQCYAPRPLADTVSVRPWNEEFPRP